MPLMAAGLGHEVLPFPAQGGDEMVDDAAGRGEELHHHAGDDHGGNEVRKIGDGLGGFFEALILHLVQQQGQDDGRGKIEHQVIQIDQQRIAHQPP